MVVAVVVSTAIGSMACRYEVERYCEAHRDCEGTSYPFCDLEGQFAESGGHGRTCIHWPVVPSNNLDARFGPAIDLGDGAHIDTTTGIVLDGDGSAVDIPTQLVEGPEDGADIRVFRGDSIVLRRTTIVGIPAVAFVASGPVEVRGLVELEEEGGFMPGAIAHCDDGSLEYTTGGSSCAGAAGGAFGAPGGAGGDGSEGSDEGIAATSPVGTETLVPLRGGCAGGHVKFIDYQRLYAGGGKGGGAIQVTSMQSIAIGPDGSGGAIVANGTGGTYLRADDGGGCGAGGGGSGGAILLEAPLVEVGQNALVLANGGGGSCTGADAPAVPTSGERGPGAVCEHEGDGGAGGAHLTPAEKGSDGDYSGGGGGGSVGRIRINTIDGAFAAGGVISPAPSVGQAQIPDVPAADVD